MIGEEEIIRTLDALSNWQGSLSLTDKERVALTFAVEYIKNGAERPRGMWKIDGTDYADGKVTAIYLSHEFHGLDYAKFVPDRPHGEWIEHKWAEEVDGHLVSNYECSCCHSWNRKNTDFCPNCGASMISSNSEIEKSKSEIVPDYRDGWRLREGEAE